MRLEHDTPLPKIAQRRKPRNHRAGPQRDDDTGRRGMPRDRNEHSARIDRIEMGFGPDKILADIGLQRPVSALPTARQAQTQAGVCASRYVGEEPPGIVWRRGYERAASKSAEPDLNALPSGKTSLAAASRDVKDASSFPPGLQRENAKTRECPGSNRGPTDGCKLQSAASTAEPHPPSCLLLIAAAGGAAVGAGPHSVK